MTKLTELTDRAVLALSIDQLAFLSLAHLESSGEWNSHNFLINAQSQGRDAPALSALSEAMNWLVAHGLVAREGAGNSFG